MKVASSTERPTGPVALIVDQDESIRALLKSYLRGIGFSCITVENGEDALDIAHTMPLSVIFLDSVLPSLDGFEVASRIRRTDVNGKTPIAIITVEDQLGTMSRAFSAGASFFLQKPITRKGVSSLLTAIGFTTHPARLYKAG
jgi:DNA-binding response OmpR family regulator